MKRVSIVVFIGFVGAALLYGALNQPLVEGSLAIGFYLLWSAGAIVLGFFGFVFPKKINEGNARSFEKMYESTKFPLFSQMAKSTLGEEQSIVTPAVGAIFLAIGLIILIRYLLALLGA